MTNNEVAQIFHSMGDILELENQNPFRVRAYHQAAKTIEFLDRPLSQIYTKDGRDGLEAIAGIGATLTDKIIELLETGSLKAYEELKKDIPAGELVLNDIPGVGPKTVKKIYEAFKPKDLAHLKKKLLALKPDKSGKRRSGEFQEKTIANLLRGLEILENQTGRMLVSEALAIAEIFIDALKKVSGVTAIDPVGSLRRMKESIGDVDIIVASDDPHAVIDAATSIPGITQVLARGDTKAMVQFGTTGHVDVEVLPKAEYGSLLQHFTGSKEHNIAMRTLADSLGLSFSEHGFKISKPNHAWAKKAVTQAKKEKRWDAQRGLILCNQEEQVYATIGLDWIPPELRENAGELEAARNHSLPKLVETNDIRGDIHVHSKMSGDGREEPQVVIERAIALGYQYIGITDHTKGLGIAGKLTDKELLQHAESLRKLNQRYPEIRVLLGCELNILADGRLDVPDDILEQLDVVIASVHTAMAQSDDVMTERIIRALRNPHVDILAHPTTRLIGYREEIAVDWQQVFAVAAETGTALEINASPQRLDLDGVRIRMAKQAGCKFVISTDAHHLSHLDNMRFGVAQARRGWCEAADILNTQSEESFLAWLAD